MQAGISDNEAIWWWMPTIEGHALHACQLHLQRIHGGRLSSRGKSRVAEVACRQPLRQLCLEHPGRACIMVRKCTQANAGYDMARTQGTCTFSASRTESQSACPLHTGTWHAQQATPVLTWQHAARGKLRKASLL